MKSKSILIRVVVVAAGLVVIIYLVLLGERS